MLSMLSACYCAIYLSLCPWYLGISTLCPRGQALGAFSRSYLGLLPFSITRPEAFALHAHRLRSDEAHPRCAVVVIMCSSFPMFVGICWLARRVCEDVRRVRVVLDRQRVCYINKKISFVHRKFSYVDDIS